MQKCFIIRQVDLVIHNRHSSSDNHRLRKGRPAFTPEGILWPRVRLPLFSGHIGRKSNDHPNEFFASSFLLSGCSSTERVLPKLFQRKHKCTEQRHSGLFCFQIKVRSCAFRSFELLKLGHENEARRSVPSRVSSPPSSS